MVAFATKSPTGEELENFRLVMSLAACGYGGFEGGDEISLIRWARELFDEG